MTELSSFTKLQMAIDRVIVAVPFQQNCTCDQCTAMRDLQQAALASMRAPSASGDPHA